LVNGSGLLGTIGKDGGYYKHQTIYMSRRTTQKATTNAKSALHSKTLEEFYSHFLSDVTEGQSSR
jgi:hypothetical protein